MWGEFPPPAGLFIPLREVLPSLFWRVRTIPERDIQIRRLVDMRI